MKNELVKKSLIFGTIILLAGASVLSVVNAKQIQDQIHLEKNIVKNIDSKPLNARPSRHFFVKYNITFHTSVNWFAYYRYVSGSSKLFAFRSESNESVDPPVATINITTLDDEPIISTIWYAPLKVFIFWGKYYDTNLTRDDMGIDPDGGYFSGQAFFLRYR